MTPRKNIHLYLYLSCSALILFTVAKPILAGLSYLENFAEISAIIHTVSLFMPFWTAGLAIEMEPTLLECNTPPIDFVRSIIVLSLTVTSTTTAWGYYQKPSMILYAATMAITLLSSIVDVIGTFFLVRRYAAMSKSPQDYSTI